MSAPVPYLQVEFGAVERGLTLGLDQRRFMFAEHFARGGAQGVLGVLPLLGGAEVHLAVVSEGQADVVDWQAEHTLGVQRGPKGAFDLDGDLVSAAEYVGVVEVDLPDSAQSGHNPGALGSEHGGQLVEPDR